jgi:hypothetical protein
MSDACDLDVQLPKISVKSGGQECPPYISRISTDVPRNPLQSVAFKDVSR